MPLFLQSGINLLKVTFLRPIFLSFLFATLAYSQDAAPTPPPPPEPSELRLLRQQVQQQTLTASTTLTEQYIKALAAIEQEAAASGDYEQAHNAQQRRTALAQVQSLASLTNTIVLKPSQARLVGAVNYDTASDSLGPWRAAGNSATWDVTKITPGSYDIIVTYGVASTGDPPARYIPTYNPRTGGEFEFFEASNLAGAALNRRTAIVADTGAWTTHNTLQLSPPFQLTRTTASFSVRITRANGDGGVMQLKEIRLTPSAPSNTTTLALDTPSDPVNTLRSVYQQKYKTIATPIITSYLQALQTRLAEATSLQQIDSIAELQAELDRTTKWLERPLAPARTRAAISLFEDAEEEWTDVTFVNHASNTGDRFLIQHQGKQIPVRLKTVTCPPPTDEAAGELQHYAAYFHINPENALAIGKQAREFTATALANKPLRLLTNGQKDRDGTLRVTIYVPHLGDYAGILVDNGLAAITPLPKPRRDSRLVIPDPCHGALKERESTARARPTPPGAWAFSDPPTALP
ncbi:hypothetical protein FEM03_04170 [Phragmitibacter flavus]|uniref:Uncharacterized protein n=1 Tax=Phragmitibacter flavus TaxID=2576071 RepID=A0A5R8KHZ6_9BACT|nr:hypothetical protein [Phragmitibacter flavus]TLD71928.1 hypothetical protein FEM03_04170 [Phragmitibacter flavus]